MSLRTAIRGRGPTRPKVCLFHIFPIIGVEVDNIHMSNYQLSIDPLTQQASFNANIATNFPGVPFAAFLDLKWSSNVSNFPPFTSNGFPSFVFGNLDSLSSLVAFTVEYQGIVLQTLIMDPVTGEQQ